MHITKDTINTINEIMESGLFIKFTEEKEYAEQLKHGIHMMPASYFIDNGNCAQQDKKERNALYPIWCCSHIDVSDLRKGITFEEGYYYLTIINSEVTSNMLKMCREHKYKYAAIIFQPDIYISRIIKLIEYKHSSLKLANGILCGFINIELGSVIYTDEDQDKFTELLKRNKEYCYQQEFRFVMNWTASENKECFNTTCIGDLNYNQISVLTTQDLSKQLSDNKIIIDDNIIKNCLKRSIT